MEAAAALSVNTKPVVPTLTINTSSPVPKSANGEHDPTIIPMTPGTARLFAVRTLVTTKEAGIIIGRGGKNVADIRERSGARITISEMTHGAVERVLSVSGSVEVIAKGFGLIAEKMLEETAANMSPLDLAKGVPNQATFRILVHQARVGAIIGKAGAKIKDIQATSGARLFVSAEPLPNTADRTVTLQGVPTSVESAMHQVAEVLYESERTYPTVSSFKPSAAQAAVMPGSFAAMPFAANPFAFQNLLGYGMPVMSPVSPGGVRTNGKNISPPAASPLSPLATGMLPFGAAIAAANAGRAFANVSSTQQIYVPREMVGCIIGKKGAKILEIRNLSGAHVQVQKGNDTDREQLVTISGSPEAIQVAIYLISSRIEAEKARLQNGKVTEAEKQ